MEKTSLKGFYVEIKLRPAPCDKHDFDLSVNNQIPFIVQRIAQERKALPRTFALKCQIRVHAFLEKFSFELEKDILIEAWFCCSIFSQFGNASWQGKVEDALAQCKTNFENFVQVGSGWTLKKIDAIYLFLMKYRPFFGGCFLKKLPSKLRKKKGIIILKNEQNGRCFLTAVIAALLKKERNMSRQSKIFADLIECFPETFQKFPITARDIAQFEKVAPISVNVYGFDNVLFPYYISEEESKKYHVDLLLHHRHYYAIKSLSSLVSTKKHRRKTFVCQFCLAYFVNEKRFKMHQQLCGHKLQQFVFPTEEKKFMKFRFFQSLLEFPFVIYADIESMIVNQVDFVPKGKLLGEKRHIAIAVCARTVCRLDEKHSSGIFLHVGEDCIEKFFLFIESEVQRVQKLFDRSVPLYMLKSDWEEFKKARHCYMCKGDFSRDKLIKVRDHCHISGRFRFALCSKCNLTFAKPPRKLCVFFHGLNNYDQHFLVSKLGQIPSGRVQIVPKTSEKYLTFSIGCVQFKDSFEFLGASLSSLVRDLTTKGEACFKNVNTYFDNAEQRNLLYRKGVFPYNYISSLSKLEEKTLPPLEGFFNHLTKSHISQEEYNFAVVVWEKFKCQTLRDYLCIYLLADVLLLADVFENFRSTSLKNYDLDPVYYLSNSQFTLNAFLWKTQSNLELFTDINKYLFVQKGIRGGVSMAVKRFAEANNEFVPNFDPEKEKSFIVYLDCNNLYGQAMAQYLPVSNFKWIPTKFVKIDKILNKSPQSPKGYIVECTLMYPSHLHKKHSDYPLAPYHGAVPKKMRSSVANQIAQKNDLKPNATTEKLLCTLLPRVRYVLHYRVLQLYLQLGLKLVQIHRVLKFNQCPVLQPYIAYNTEKRAEAKNHFDSGYFKLMSNSLFGKTMERPDKRVKVSLVNDIQTFVKKVGDLNLKSVSRINQDLVSIQSKYASLKIDKPIYLGMCILDLAKMFMYNFHYNVMMKFYSPEDICLMYTDTDSLIYHIKTNDVFQDFAQLKEHFDFSNYPPDHPLFSQDRKRIPGFFKDETGGKIISKFVALKAKMYSFVVEDGQTSQEIKAAKGVHKSILSQDLKFENYKDCLFEQKIFEHEYSTIRSQSHQVFTKKQKKVSLSSFDDKRYLISTTESVPYGHVNYS